MTKVKLADKVTKSCLKDDNNNFYCSIPILIEKRLNIEGLFDKLAEIDPDIKNYHSSESYWTIFVKLPLDIELEVEDIQLHGGQDVYEINWGLPRNLFLLHQIPCFVSKNYWKK